MRNIQNEYNDDEEDRNKTFPDIIKKKTVSISKDTLITTKKQKKGELHINKDGIKTNNHVEKLLSQ
jgi:hypothetical protein